MSDNDIAIKYKGSNKPNHFIFLIKGVGSVKHKGVWLPLRKSPLLLGLMNQVKKRKIIGFQYKEYFRVRVYGRQHIHIQVLENRQPIINCMLHISQFEEAIKSLSLIVIRYTNDDIILYTANDVAENAGFEIHEF